MEIIKVIVKFVFWHSVCQESPSSIIKYVTRSRLNVFGCSLTTPYGVSILIAPNSSPIHIFSHTSFVDILLLTGITIMVQEQNVRWIIVVTGTSLSLGFLMLGSWKLGRMNFGIVFDCDRMRVSASYKICCLYNGLDHVVSLI